MRGSLIGVASIVEKMLKNSLRRWKHALRRKVSEAVRVFKAIWPCMCKGRGEKEGRKIGRENWKVLYKDIQMTDVSMWRGCD